MLSDYILSTCVPVNILWYLFVIPKPYLALKVTTKCVGLQHHSFLLSEFARVVLSLT